MVVLYHFDGVMSQPMAAVFNQRLEFGAGAGSEIFHVDVEIEVLAVGLAAGDGEAGAQKEALLGVGVVSNCRALQERGTVPCWPVQ